MKAVIGTLLLCLSFLAVAVRVAGEQKETKGKADVYAALGKAPEKARHRLNPLENDPEAASAGRVLFLDHCAECHGENAEGAKKGPSLRAPEVQNAAPGTIFWILTNGVVRKGMPVWSRLPEPQRWQLVRYLKSLGTAEPAASAEESKPKP